MAGLLILIPLLVILLLNVFPRKMTNALALWLGLAWCLVQCAMAVLVEPSAWDSAQFGIHDLIGWLPIASSAGNDLARVMYLAIGIVGATALMVSGYTTPERARNFLLVNLIMLAVAGMNGIVLARDLFSIYVYIEITAVASFVMIAFDRGIAAFEGAFKYIVLSAVATALILASIGLLLLVAGGVSFADVASAVEVGRNEGTTQWLLVLSFVLFMVGLFIKSGLMPFHAWLPDAYTAAPAPVSILLAGIVTKTTGVYTLIQIVVNVFSMPMNGFVWPMQTQVLLIVGALSVVFAAFAALGQSDFKRMLAYSSISQVGYIILGLGIGTPLGIAGAIFHLFNHAIFKTLLFVNATAVEKETGTRDMNRMGGISNQMPVTGTTSVIAFLSTAGVPPLSGFWSKLMIIVALWKGGFPAVAIIAVLASLVTLAYFLSMQRRVFFGKTVEEFRNLHEASWWATLPAIVLALITIGLGFGFPWLFETFLVSVRSIL